MLNTLSPAWATRRDAACSRFRMEVAGMDAQPFIREAAADLRVAPNFADYEGERLFILSEHIPEIRGYMHPYIGEEATGVGAIHALDADDNIVATYHEHAHALCERW